MKVLTIAATELEIELLRSTLPEVYKENVDFKVTGIGSLITTFNLTTHLFNKTYDWVIQAGIAGTLDPEIPVGSVCQVVTETLSDLGSEDEKGILLDVFDLNLMEKNLEPFIGGILINPIKINIPELIEVNGSTLNKSLGTNLSINHFRNRFPKCQIESMEGGALFYVCNSLNKKFIEIRAISNLVEERNRASWQITLALNNLNKMFCNVLNSILTIP
jgi:futalosine hydrolase